MKGPIRVQCKQCRKWRILKGNWYRLPERCKDCNIKRAKVPGFKLSYL